MLIAHRGCIFALRIILFGVGLLPVISLAADIPPRVIGFERMHGAPESNAIEAGQLLLGELNCTSCHLAEPALATAIQRKSAPVLDSVSSRVKPQYLLKFLTDPQSTKPGTTMPNVLAGLSLTEREP